MIIRIFFVFILSLFLASCASTRVANYADSTRVLSEENFELALLKNDWYQFTEREAGYSINYPQNAHLTISHDVVLEYPHIYITLMPSPQAVQIIVYPNPAQLSVKEIVAQNVYQGELSASEVEKLSLEPITVAGLDAMKMDKSPYLPGIFISANSKVYFISLPMEMMSGNVPSSDSVDLFYEIVNTFSLKQ